MCLTGLGTGGAAEDDGGYGEDAFDGAGDDVSDLEGEGAGVVSPSAIASAADSSKGKSRVTEDEVNDLLIDPLNFSLEGEIPVKFPRLVGSVSGTHHTNHMLSHDQ